MSKSHAGTHEENRFKVCLLCFGKTKVMIKIGGNLQNLVEAIFQYDKSDGRLPVVLCSGCKRDIYRVKNGTHKDIRLPDISKISVLKRFTRSNASALCNCHVCIVARTPKAGNFAKNGILPKRKSILCNNETTSKCSIFKSNILI